MNFEENVKNFSNRTDMIKEGINTEEATKTSLIMPFFQILGYDVFNPLEFTPEFTADVGIKKGEKVDYAILSNNDPVILIEAKSVKEELKKHDSQLFRYFGTSKAKFAILTNGIIYRFYTDLDAPNKMDDTPFLEINMLDLKESQILELKKFHKENFDINNIVDTASELKYTGLMRSVIKNQFTTPSDEFVKLLLNEGIYDGVKTQNILDKFKPIAKKSIVTYINELVNEKIQAALNNGLEKEIPEYAEPVQIDDDVESEINEIITTEEEIGAFYIIKSILRDGVDISRITYKDTLSYFVIILDNKVSRWICRIYLKENVQYVIIPGENKEVNKYTIESLDDIYTLKDQLIQRLEFIK